MTLAIGKKGKQMKVICSRIVAVAVTLLMLSSNSFGEDISPSKILKKVTEKYKTIETYKAKGTITSDMNISGIRLVNLPSVIYLLMP